MTTRGDTNETDARSINRCSCVYLMVTLEGSIMDREYMLGRIDKRLYDLQLQYQQLCDDNATGTQSGLACRRSRVKRDICILTLLYEVIYQCRSCEITKEDSLLGFEKLVKDF